MENISLFEFRFLRQKYIYNNAMFHITFEGPLCNSEFELL